MAVCAAAGFYNKQSAKQLDVSFYRYVFDLYTPRTAYFFELRRHCFTAPALLSSDGIYFR
jgi:hypothetical protein